MQIKEIFDQFEHKGRFNAAEAIHSGHINTSYLISTDGSAPKLRFAENKFVCF